MLMLVQKGVEFHHRSPLDCLASAADVASSGVKQMNDSVYWFFVAL